MSNCSPCGLQSFMFLKHFLLDTISQKIDFKIIKYWIIIIHEGHSLWVWTQLILFGWVYLDPFITHCFSIVTLVLVNLWAREAIEFHHYWILTPLWFYRLQVGLPVAVWRWSVAWSSLPLLYHLHLTNNHDLIRNCIYSVNTKYICNTHHINNMFQ